MTDKTNGPSPDPPSLSPPPIATGNVEPLLKRLPQPKFDVDWFYEDEDFFTEWMDAFDW
ncbi:MAG: hypothetical protein AAFQ67_01230 [Pseudomonadota bacterium]